MSRIWITLGMTLLLSTGAQAQDLKPKVNEKGKVGFVDASGCEVVPCKYESAAPFEDGVAVVSKGGKYGLVNQQGTEIVKLQYEELTPWGNHLYLAKKSKKYGILGTDGSTKLEVKYTHISRLNCYGKAWMSLGGKVVSSNGKQIVMRAKYGVVNSDGTVAVEALHKGLFEFSLSASPIAAMHEGMRPQYRAHTLGDTLLTAGQYYAMTKNENSSQDAGVLSATGQELMPMGKASWIIAPQSNMVRCYDVSKERTTSKYFNIDSQQMITVAVSDCHIDKITNWTHSDFNGDIAAVNSTEGWKFIDKQGNVLKSGYSSIQHSVNTKAWAGTKKTEGICDAFDENGRPLFAEDVKIEAIDFSENTSHTDLLAVKQGDKWGVISREGKVVIPFQYERALSPWYNYVPVKTSQGWGLRTLDNKEVVPCQYLNMKTMTEENPHIQWVQKTDNLWYAYDIAQRQLRPTGYELAVNYENGYAWVKPQGLKVDDDQVNRGMIGAAAKCDVSDDLFMSVNSYFGCLLGLDGSVYAEGPYYIGIKPELVKLMHANGDKKLTKAQNKKMRLYLTRSQRSYPMTKKIDNDDWDF